MVFGFKELFKGFSLFAEKDRGILGVDLGSSSIKIVQLRKEKERAILETYGEIATGPYANLQIGQVAKLTEDAVIQALKDVLKESNVKAKNAVVAIPLKSSFVTVVTLPFASNGDLSKIIELEARRYIPVPISEVVLSWWVIPEPKGRDGSDGTKKEIIKVLLVAVHKDTVDLYKRVVTQAGLSPIAYEIEAFSMIRSGFSREIVPTAVFDFGASSTKLAVVDYGAMKASYIIGRGSQDLTMALSNSMNIDFRRAEETKREIGLSNLPEHREVVAVLEPVLDFVFSEVNKFIVDFQRKNNRSVGKIVLTGGGSLLKGLPDFAIKRFAVEVELANPFSRMEHPVFLTNALADVGMNFAVAAGLALREL